VKNFKLVLLVAISSIAVALYALLGPAVGGLFSAIAFAVWCFVRSSTTETRKIDAAAQESADWTNALRGRELAERNR
jgi:hypothetical protein